MRSKTTQDQQRIQSSMCLREACGRRLGLFHGEYQGELCYTLALFLIALLMLKKTLASLIRKNRHYQGLELLFLDHAPVSMADRHYTTFPQDLLNEAILWLGDAIRIRDVFKAHEQSVK